MQPAHATLSRRLRSRNRRRVRRHASGRSHYNYFRDYDPQTGRYVESDPIGLAGGTSVYGYAGADPVILADASGLFTLNVLDDRWDTVPKLDDYPNTYIPLLSGPFVLGETKARIGQAECKCETCGAFWKLTKCSAEYLVTVQIVANLNARADRFGRFSESQHVQDLHNGEGRIRTAGTRAEDAQKLKQFSSEVACQRESSSAVTAAIKHARFVIMEESFGKHDASGEHGWNGGSPF